jgi:hypothetical protein
MLATTLQEEQFSVSISAIEVETTERKEVVQHEFIT